MTTQLLRGDSHHCHRCGYYWTSRTPGKVPKKCPACQNPRWATAPPKTRPWSEVKEKWLSRMTPEQRVEHARLVAEAIEEYNASESQKESQDANA